MWGRIRKHRGKTSFRSLPGDLRKHSNRNTVAACEDTLSPPHAAERGICIWDSAVISAPYFVEYGHSFLPELVVVYAS